jgi:hypothetical protein
MHQPARILIRFSVFAHNFAAAQVAIGETPRSRRIASTGSGGL